MQNFTFMDRQQFGFYHVHTTCRVILNIFHLWGLQYMIVIWYFCLGILQISLLWNWNQREQCLLSLCIFWKGFNQVTTYGASVHSLSLFQFMSPSVSFCCPSLVQSGDSSSTLSIVAIASNVKYPILSSKQSTNV